MQKTLAAGKLTEPVLRMFLATGNVGVLEWVKVLKIRPITNPIFPTRKLLCKSTFKLSSIITLMHLFIVQLSLLFPNPRMDY